jgi:hypothetical protein
MSRREGLWQEQPINMEIPVIIPPPKNDNDLRIGKEINLRTRITFAAALCAAP